MHSWGAAEGGPTVVEAAEGRLHNSGWGDKWLDKVDETFFAIVSKTCHTLYPAIHRGLEARGLVSVAQQHLLGVVGGFPPPAAAPAISRLGGYPEDQRCSTKEG